jgi:hypothetical protein
MKRRRMKNETNESIDGVSPSLAKLLRGIGRIETDTVFAPEGMRLAVRFSLPRIEILPDLSAEDGALDAMFHSLITALKSDKEQAATVIPLNVAGIARLDDVRFSLRRNDDGGAVFEATIYGEPHRLASEFIASAFLMSPALGINAIMRCAERIQSGEVVAV